MTKKNLKTLSLEKHQMRGDKYSYFLLFSLLLFIFGCSKEEIKKSSIKFKEIKVYKDMVMHQRLLGGKGVFFSKAFKDKTEPDYFKVGLTSNPKLLLKLKRGDSQAPNEFGELSSVCGINNFLFIFEDNFKIVIKNENLKTTNEVRTTDIFRNPNFFFSNDKLFFTSFSFNSDRDFFIYKIKLSHFEKKSELITEVLQDNIIDEVKINREMIKPFGYFMRNKEDIKKFYFVPNLWMAQKDTKLYYSTNQSKILTVYDCHTKNTEKIELKFDFLKAKKIKNSEAKALGELDYKNREMKRTFPDFKIKFNFKAYPQPLYFLGRVDAGGGYLGFLNDLDLKKREFQIHIIDIKTMTYVESITLPIFASLISKLSGRIRDIGLYLDYPSKTIVYEDIDEEENPFLRKISW